MVKYAVVKRKGMKPQIMAVYADEEAAKIGAQIDAIYKKTRR